MKSVEDAKSCLRLQGHASVATFSFSCLVDFDASAAGKILSKRFGVLFPIFSVFFVYIFQSWIAISAELVAQVFGSRPTRLPCFFLFLKAKSEVASVRTQFFSNTSFYI